MARTLDQNRDMRNGHPSSSDRYSNMKLGRPQRDKIDSRLAQKLDAELARLPAKQKAQYLRDVYYST